MKDPNPRVPEPKHPFKHSLPLQIRFSDIDMLGHLNNNVYLQFLDLGKSLYFEAVMPGAISRRKVEIVVVNVNVDFLAPTYFGEPVAVYTQCTHIGDRSLQLEQRVVNTQTGQTKCIGRTVMAGFDPETAQGAPISPAWVAALEAYESRPLK